MTKLWKKIIHITAVLFVAMAMVFSFLEPKSAVLAEGEEDSGTPVPTDTPDPTDSPSVTPESTAVTAPEETPSVAPAEQPVASPATDQDTDNQTYAITIDPIDTDDAYYDGSDSLYVVPGKTIPFHPVVHENNENGPVVKDAEVQLTAEDPDHITYDEKNQTLTTAANNYFSDYITLTYGNTQKEIYLNNTDHYTIGFSEHYVRLEPQTTSDQSVRVTVHDNFKNTDVVNPDYEVSAGTGSVSFDKATGKVTSYDQYGESDLVFSYKDATASLSVYVYAPVQELKFNQDEINMKVGDDSFDVVDSAYLNVEPEEGRNAPVQVVSDHPDVVSVSNWDGEPQWYVQPLKEGTAVITVTSGNVSASVTINVSAAGKADSIQFDPKYDQNSERTKDIYLKSGESADLKSYLFDTNGNDVTEAAKDEITYKLDNQHQYGNVADFKLNGTKITATGTGSTSVTASIGNGWSKMLTWNVHVRDKDPKSIKFGKEKYRVHLKDNYYTAYVSLSSDDMNTDDFEYTIKSKDESIVKVIKQNDYSYYLDPVKTGKTTIEAETYNGIKATAEVTVDDGDFATSISSDTMDKAIPMKPGDTLKLEPVYTLMNGKATKEKPKDEKVTYSISDDYSPYVKLTDNKDGTATVKALDFNNYIYVNAELTNGFSTSWRIQITPDITSLHFRKKECTVTDETEYESLSQYLDVLPKQAEGSELAWASSDVRTATVDNYGNVHIIKYGGDTTVTVSSKDGKVKDSILVHCMKAEAPKSITVDKGDDINLYTGYTTQFSIGNAPEYSSSKYQIKIDDPDHVTNLSQDDYSSVINYSSIAVTGKKKGDAKIVIMSAKDPSVQKTVNIHVKEGKPSDKDLDIDYQVISGGYGWDGIDDPSVELFKDNDSAIGVLHPKKFTFLKGHSYDILLRYRNYLPVNGFVKDESGLLKFPEYDYGYANGNGSYPSGYSLQSEWFTADKEGTGKIRISDSYIIEYQVVDAEVSEKPQINTGNASGELKDEIKKITNESIGMDSVLTNAAGNLDFTSNEKVQKATENLRKGQKLKIEITNEVKYESVEETKAGKKITVSITPKYVVKVINSSTGNQEGKIVDEGELDVKQNVTLKVPVGKDVEEGRTLYVRHILKNGTSRIYEGTVDQDGNLVFDNPDGFSTFEITVNDPSTVKYGSVGYESLEDALNNGLVQGTVHILKGYNGKTDVTVKREMKFILDNQSDKTFDIKAGDGYTLSRDESGEYHITQNYQKEDDNTKADWGKPVFTFTDNGTKATAVRTNRNNGSQTEKVTAKVELTGTTAPTCTEKGQTVYTATAVFKDGQTYTDQYTVETGEPVGHDLTHVSAVPSTKDHAGNTEYWKCTRCGKYFSDANGTNEIDPASVVLPQSKITGISWSQEPTGEEKTWTTGSEFHYAGKAVLAYENGETSVVNVTKDLFDLDGYNADQTGEQTVTLKLKADNSFTLSETVTVTAKKSGQKNPNPDQKAGGKSSTKNTGKNSDQKAGGMSSTKNTGKNSDSVKKNNQKKTASQKKNSSAVVDTSDHSNISFYGCALVVAVIALAAVFWIRKKHA